jgi:hypothetical protein
MVAASNVLILRIQVTPEQLLSQNVGRLSEVRVDIQTVFCFSSVTDCFFKIYLATPSVFQII